MTKKESQLIITINQNKCVGSTMCIQISPKAFALNEKRKAIVANPNADTLSSIKEAAEGCPMMAISIKDAKSGDVIFPKALPPIHHSI